MATELPYLKNRTAFGANDPTREVAREPSHSSHYASPVRTQMMKNLGLKESGFFADWRKRTRSPSYADASGFGEDAADTNLQGPGLKSFGQQAIKAQLPEKAAGPANQFNLEPDQQGGDSYTGLTRYQLHETELGSTWNRMRNRIADNPILSTSVLDTMQATMINMDRQMAMNMTAHPMMLLGQAAMDYFQTHNQPAIGQSNFEKIVSEYSETKKIAKKNINYAGAEMAKTISQLKKNPTYTGAENMLNIGRTGSYSPSYYSPPL